MNAGKARAAMGGRTPISGSQCQLHHAGAGNESRGGVQMETRWYRLTPARHGRSTAKIGDVSLDTTSIRDSMGVVGGAA